jgi:dienelactone hydrolase
MQLIRLWLSSSLCLAAGCMAQQAPRQQPVTLNAPDGTILKGTYFGSARPGPGVLLLHQCNQQRKLWDVLGERMASSGINVLTLDYRGFGESGGARYDKLAPNEQSRISTETWPGDIDIAFQYLLAQPGVDRGRIGAGGASCGVDNSVKLAQRHPEVKALMLLAGETDRAGRHFVETSNGIPIFASAADDDIYGRQVLEMQWLFSLSRNPSSRFAHYATGGHGAEMFLVHKDLPGTIAEWFAASLMNQPSRIPATNGSPMQPQVLRALDLIDQQGGTWASQMAKTLPAASAPFPEFIVNLLGYEHLQLNDTKGAVEIMKVNAAAYPNSPNAFDSLSDAYLAGGRKDLALQNAKKALELLANDKTDAEKRRNAIRESAEQKVKQLAPPRR